MGHHQSRSRVIASLKNLPFARKLTRKTLRFSEVGLRQWQSARK